MTLLAWKIQARNTSWHRVTGICDKKVDPQIESPSPLLDD